MMRPSPALVELIVELHQLGSSDRKSLLSRLDPGDREIIQAQLTKLARRPAPSFDALASLSPWLAESLAAARSGDGGVLTPATREALLDAERLLPTKAQPKAGLAKRLFQRGALS